MAIKIRPRIYKIYAGITVPLILLGFVGYYFFVRGQTQNLETRLLRQLDMMGQHVGLNVQAVTQALWKTAEDRLQDGKLGATALPELKRQLLNDWKKVRGLQSTLYLNLDWRAADTVSDIPRTAFIQPEVHDGALYLKADYTFPPHQGRSLSISFKVHLSPEFLFGHLSHGKAFERLLVLDLPPGGNNDFAAVIYQITGDAGAVIALSDLQGIDGEPWKVTQGFHHAQVERVRFAGQTQVLFTLPVTVPGLNSNGKLSQGDTWSLIGLVPRKDFQSQAFAFSPNLGIILLVTVLLLILALPMIRFQFLGPTNRLETTAVIFLFLAVSLGLFTILTAGLDMLVYRGFTTLIRSELQVLAANISQNFSRELQLATIQLNQLDQKRQIYYSSDDPQEPPPNRENLFGQDPEAAAFYPYYTSVYWANADGKQVYRWKTKSTPSPLIDVSQREYFTRLRHGTAWPQEPISLPPPCPCSSEPAPCTACVAPWLHSPDNEAHRQAVNLPGQQFYIQPIYSWTTAKYEIVLATEAGDPIGLAPDQEQVGGDFNGIAAMIPSFFSLTETLLPKGFGFAITDRSGTILFQDSGHKFLNENFFAGVDNPRKLQGAVATGVRKAMDIKLHGEDVQIYVTPLSQHIPWSLMVYHQRGMLRSFNVVLLSQTTDLFLLYYFLLAGTAYLAYRMAVRSHKGSVPWLWPNRDKRPEYLRLSLLFALSIFWLLTGMVVLPPTARIAQICVVAACACFASGHLLSENNDLVRRLLKWSLPFTPLLVALFPHGPGQAEFHPLNLLSALLFPFLMLVSKHPAWIQRWAASGSTTGHYSTAFSLFLGAVVALPTASIFKTAMDFEVLLFYKQTQMDFVQKLKTRDHNLYMTNQRQYNRILKNNREMLAELKLAELKLAELKLAELKRNSADNPTEDKHTVAEIENLKRNIKNQRRLRERRNYYLERDASPTNTYKVPFYSLGVYTMNLFQARREAPTATLKASREPFIHHFLGALVPHFNEVTVQQTNLVNHTISDRGLGWTQEKDTLTLRKRDQTYWKYDYVLESLMGNPWDRPARAFAIFGSTDNPSFQGSPAKLEGPRIALQWFLTLALAVTLLIGLVYLFYALVRYTLIRLFLLDLDKPHGISTERLMVKIKAPPKGSHLWVLCSQDPELDMLPSHALTLDVPAAMTTSENWVDTLIEQVKEASSAKQPPTLLLIKQFGFTPPQEDPAAPHLGAQRFELLQRLEPRRRDRRLVVLSCFDPRALYHSRGSKTGKSAKEQEGPESWSPMMRYFKLVRLEQNIPFPEKAAENSPLDAELKALLRDEVVHHRATAEAATHLLVQDERFIGRDSLYSAFGDLVSDYYHEIWSFCSPIERAALFDLAEDGFVNPNFQGHIRRLMMRGLIVRDPALRIMNETFRLFILQNFDVSELAHSAEDEDSWSWNAIKIPLTILILCAAAFLFLTQQDMFNFFATLLSTIFVGILPGLVKAKQMMDQVTSSKP